MASGLVPTTNSVVPLSPNLSFAASDRRRSQRFPIVAPAEYILDGHRAKATTLDLSSGGVLLQTGAFLQIGQQIVVLIDWPVLLEHRLPIRLVILGEVLRSDLAGTAVGITRHEFRISAQRVARLSA